MDTKAQTAACFNCSKPESASPLICLRYAGRDLHVCPQCMPTLIHDTAALTARLSEMSDGSAS